ncbi:hypothetical protein EDB95_2017 [Dinghuibacter silviterrae]|uniref:Uncharacterized protein n=2 Tax=Dinghuibacter silviterrae TaxID=1539049 RepID=A0A4R8DSY4_9BACT|nr:hypothetical protein EDB95_2017 [Dinghuibacter silviterrae]
MALAPAAAMAAPGDSALIAQCLHRLAVQQLRKDSFYYAGMFRTYRTWAASPGTLREDNAIFYTGLIVFTLRQLEPLLTEGERAVCDSIVTRALKAYPYFRNANGRPTFNFWPTDHPVFFPNATVLSRFRRSKQITDDLDDTSILWLGAGIPDSTARRLQVLMDAHAAGPGHRANSTYRAVRDLPAYSAWFGIRTPIELDAGVVANVLYFLRDRGLTPDAHDSASVRFLAYVVQKRKYWTDPAFASTYYPRTPVLLYHLARFMGRFPDLDAYRGQVKADLREAMAGAKDGMDRVILGTSLLRLGDTAGLRALSPRLGVAHGVGARPDDGASPDALSPEDDPFLFYIANIASLFPNPIRRMALHNPLFIYHFYSPAYNDALLLEYLVLRRAAATGG